MGLESFGAIFKLPAGTGLQAVADWVSGLPRCEETAGNTEQLTFAYKDVRFWIEILVRSDAAAATDVCVRYALLNPNAADDAFLALANRFVREWHARASLMSRLVCEHKTYTPEEEELFSSQLRIEIDAHREYWQSFFGDATQVITVSGAARWMREALEKRTGTLAKIVRLSDFPIKKSAKKS